MKVTCPFQSRDREGAVSCRVEHVTFYGAVSKRTDSWLSPSGGVGHLVTTAAPLERRSTPVNAKNQTETA
jgi:hypothetical protein